MTDGADTIETATEAAEELVSEIERYLGAVELFRALGHEPSWRPEPRSEPIARVAAWLEPHESRVSGA
jgi:hypothetical protein